MTIDNPEEYCKNLWDWSILDGCFGNTLIKPTDIDGLVERKGFFLLLETKAPGVQIKPGQEYTYQRLIATGKFSIFVIWGKPGQPERLRVITRYGTKEFDCGLEGLRHCTKRWFEFANNGFQRSDSPSKGNDGKKTPT